jgi:glycerophosphoryl diester phosphodiesterase
MYILKGKLSLSENTDEMDTNCKPMIIAHRGASFHAPENTIAAVELAWRVHSDAVEIDIRQSRDGKVVVIHDPSTVRTTGVDWQVAERTFAELRTLDAGRVKGVEWAGEKIPALEEVLRTVPQSKRLFIEIKCGQEIIPEFLTVIEASGIAKGQLAVISFHADVLDEIKKCHPELETYWLCKRSSDNLEELLAKTLEIQADGVDAQASDALNEELIGKFRQAGLQIYAWTVDDLLVAKRLTTLGIDGITTNKPKEIMEEIGI